MISRNMFYHAAHWTFLLPTEISIFVNTTYWPQTKKQLSSRNVLALKKLVQTLYTLVSFFGIEKYSRVLRVLTEQSLADWFCVNISRILWYLFSPRTVSEFHFYDFVNLTELIISSKWHYQKTSLLIACVHAMRAMRASVVYVPTCPRANVPKACQHLIFTCQHANVPIKVPNVCQFFNYFSKEFVSFWIFQLSLTLANFKNIWATLENLSRETDDLNFDICKISLRKNLINLKSLTSFSMEHVKFTKHLFG